MNLRKLGALAAAMAGFMGASAAHATFITPAPPYYFAGPGGGVTINASLPAGSSGQFNIYVQSADPLATVYMQGPNDLFGTGIFDAFGYLQYNVYSEGGTYTWQETITPGHTVINWTTSGAYNNCGAESPDFYGFCAMTPTFWFDDSSISVTSKYASVVQFSPFTTPPPEAPEPVPEPLSWLLMLVGFGGLGTVLRRRRGQALA